MLNINDYPDSPLINALKDLDVEMGRRGLPKIELDVIGGFALMVHGLRDMNGYTDIDHVGPAVAKEVDEIAEGLREKYPLQPHWINNDVLLTGSSLEEMEYATGKLHFTPAFELEHIKINVLEPQDLLKMKLISIDTSLAAVEWGGDFTRMKDFKDVQVLLDYNKLTLQDAAKAYGQYMYGRTQEVIGAYLEHGEQAVQQAVRQIAFDNLKKSMSTEKEPGYTRSSLIDGVLQSAFKRADEVDFGR